MTEEEMVGWHHWLDGHEFEQALGGGDGQGGLAGCSPWGRKESDMTEWLRAAVRPSPDRSCGRKHLSGAGGLQHYLFFFNLKYRWFIGYNVVWISAVQKSDSLIQYTHNLFYPFTLSLGDSVHSTPTVQAYIWVEQESQLHRVAVTEFFSQDWKETYKTF